MVKFYELFVSFLILALLIVSLMAFSILMQEDNDVSEQFIENPVINDTYSNLRSDLISFKDESQTQKALFESENPTAGFGTILLFSIVSAGKVFNGMIIALFNSLIKLPVVILGLDPVVVSVLSAILILSIIIGLWIIYKLGG